MSANGLFPKQKTRNDMTNSVQPMTFDRARRLVPRSVECVPFRRGEVEGVTLSKGDASYEISFTGYDQHMTNAALFAVVFKPAVQALGFMRTK